MQDLDRVLDLLRPGGLLMATVILGFTWLLTEGVRRGVATLSRRRPASRLVFQQIGALGRYGLWALGALGALLFSVDLSREALAALAGVIAVAGGFALKDVATSVLAGITLLVDRPFQVGDRIHFGDHYGEVVAMGLRSVKLMTLDHSLLTIPNSRLLTDVVACGNAGAIAMMVQLDFHIGLDANLARAKQIVTDAVTTCRYATLEHPFQVVISQVILGDLPALRLRAKVYVLDLGLEKELETDVTEKISAAFAASAIAPPALLHRALG